MNKSIKNHDYLIILLIMIIVGLAISVVAEIQVQRETSDLQHQIELLEQDKMELQYKLHRAETSNYLLIKELGVEE